MVNFIGWTHNSGCKTLGELHVFVLEQSSNRPLKVEDRVSLIVTPQSHPKAKADLTGLHRVAEMLNSSMHEV